MADPTATGRHAVRRQLPGDPGAHLLALLILIVIVLVGPALILLLKNLPS